MTFYLYLIKCLTPNHYYVGITTRPEIREEEHRSRGDRCAKWVKIHGVDEFKVLERFETRWQALDAERDRVRYLSSEGYNVVSNGKFSKIGQKPGRKRKPKKKQWAKNSKLASSKIEDYIKAVVLPSVYR